MNHARQDTQHAAALLSRVPDQRSYDVYLVGVGGQGVLTIGNLISEAALRQSIPISFYPTKGMAQRGGAVKARVRLGSEMIGPNIAEKGADLVIAMEVSEALKAVRFIKPGGAFLLYGHVWPPAAVMLGKAPYPALEQVMEQIRDAGAVIHYLDPKRRPLHEGTSVAANLYVLGAALGGTGLNVLLSPPAVLELIQTRWARGVEQNTLAFEAGLAAMRAANDE
jgi:indolepyruvate ferredoxin oxidoreductase beta subunit